MTGVKFIKPAVIICEWLPFGRNNMMSLNRHLGSHKKYNSPTEFGMEGESDDLRTGRIKMLGSGFFLETVEYSFSEFLKAKMSNCLDDICAKGIEINKEGNCFIGLQYNDDLSVERTKELIGKNEEEFARQFLPMMAENQISLIEAAYGVEDIMETPWELSSYALVITESLGVPVNSTAEFLEQDENKHILMPVTDWITNHFSIDGCHVFIGMKAMVCVGQYSERMRELLKGILFQRTVLNVSMRMYSYLWKKSKKLGTISKELPDATYQSLRGFNEELGEISNEFSRQRVLSDMIIAALTKAYNKWGRIIKSDEQLLHTEAGEGFKQEIEKAEDRELIIKKMQVDIEGLKGQLQQRMSQIMTKNGQELNLTLLLLTVISVLGVADIFDFDFWQTLLVIGIVLPFTYFAIRAFLHYRKHFMGGNKWYRFW